MQTKLMSLTINPIIEHYLEQNPIEQGIVGIQLPSLVSADTIYSVVNELFLQCNIQVVIIPPPLTSIFSSGVDKDIKAIGGRVQRDRNDGIRYNRVYIALYWDSLGSLNAHHHDIFFNFEEHKVSGGYQVSISDNREFGGDKVVLANQMKTVVDTVTQLGEEKPADVLFSHKSLVLRKPDDWWIEFPEHVDTKLLAGSLLSIIKDNLNELNYMEQSIKSQLTTGSLHQGIIQTFDITPSTVRVIIASTERGKVIRLQIGSVQFFFNETHTGIHNWTQLMIDQLEAHLNLPR